MLDLNPSREDSIQPGLPALAGSFNCPICSPIFGLPVIAGSLNTLKVFLGLFKHSL